MTTLIVKTDSKKYEIHLGHGLVDKISLKSLVGKKEVLLLIDNKVPKPFVKKVENNIKKSSAARIKFLTVNASEKNKNFLYISRIYDFLIKNNFSRDSLIIGIGGGITCDITGFVGSTFLRGIDFVLIPTTLLSQVDASIGGKTGVNHKGFKNMIGTFNQPKKVIIDTSCLKTLPKLEILCGLMEIIKHGVIADSGFFNWIEKNLNQILTLKPQYIQKAVKRSIEIKADVVTKDEKELGLRAILNFGHTFGHALETIGENKLYTHGEAVALGMLAACRLSEISDDFSEKSSERISSLIKKTGINVKLKKKINNKRLIKLMHSDKKSNQGRLKFILLEKIGTAKIKVINNNQVIEKAIKNSLFY